MHVKLLSACLRKVGIGALCCGAFALQPLFAGDVSKETTTTEEEPVYNNWINLLIGGVSINGDEAQFKQEHRISGDIFGGIDDMHFEHSLGKDVNLTFDGHAIFDNADYNLRLRIDKAKVGYIEAGFTEYRDWYDGNGGFFPNNGAFFEPLFPQEMHIDRGEAWIELGLRIPNFPEITLRYSHMFREGMKDSTIWGDTTLTGLATNPARKIAPAFRGIDEKRDFFTADISQSFSNTDVALGMRYEHDEVDNTLNLWRGAGQIPPAVAFPGAQRYITQHDKNETDLFSGHFTTETRIKDYLWFTTGYSYTTESTDISGTRIIGPFYDASIQDPILTLQANDHGFLNLAGMSDVEEHVGNVNLFWMPMKSLSVLAAFRYTHENTDSASVFLDTSTAANTAPFTPTNPRGGFHRTTPVPRSADTSVEFDNLAETFEIRYTGLNNFLFYARGDWEEEDGNVFEHEVVNGVSQGQLNKDTNYFMQKYSAGFNWYPCAGANLAFQYYHRSQDYDNDFISELLSPPVPGSERNQRLLNREIDTDDVNVRLTWNPHLPQALGTVSFVARFDYLHAKYDTRWAISPTGLGNPPTNTIFNWMESGLLTDQQVSGTLTWNPLPRLYLQGTGSYVWDKTETPAGDIMLTPNTVVTVNNFYNNYWQAGGSLGFVIDDRTNLHIDYSYYKSDNYESNFIAALPYGMSDREQTISAGIDRQITKNVRLSLKYTYYDYTNVTSGGHDNYTAHAVFSGLQFRF